VRRWFDAFRRMQPGGGGSVAIAYDGATYAVLMATPSDLEDFAFGFSCTEGIVAAGGEIAELSVIGVRRGSCCKSGYQRTDR
jgi:formate dehydrogenase assembly factor FdhD